MKLRKKIGLTLLGLVTMTISGILLLTLVSRFNYGIDNNYNVTESGNCSNETAMEPMEAVSDGSKQAQETIVNDGALSTAKELLDLEDYSEAPADNGCPYFIKVNRVQNVVTVYALDEDGYYTKPIKAMLCSVGKNNRTPAGTFQTSDKHEWCSLVGGVYGQYAYRIDGQIMFHSVPYFSMNKGDLETEEYNKLGTSASLGCIRLSVADAKWIYDNCPSGTIVTIYDSDYEGPLGKPTAEKIEVGSDYAGWDPTDPDMDNPWNQGMPRILGGGLRTIQRGYTFQMACGVLALDGQGNDITSEMTVVGDVNAMKVGDYPVTYEVTDALGNKTAVSGVIRVVDTIPPELEIDTEEITLNRAQSSEINCIASIIRHIQVVDAGEYLSPDCLTVDISHLEGQSEGRFSVIVWAEDESGNQTDKKKISVSLDREAPVILEPEQKSFFADSTEELEQMLSEAIVVHDNYSGVKDVRISWVQETDEVYSVLVTAKDGYGNVGTVFFQDFNFSYGKNE